MKFNKKDFDSEYPTEYLKELDFLTSKGIRYDFVITNEKGVRVYKYKKTHALFVALSEFYKDRY
jgi:hypothetical protein